jgi:environmental stress-induced protein Ves
MVAMQLLRPHDYARTRWKNDGGWTTEIASMQRIRAITNADSAGA